jgi:hypothetical protein
MQLFCKVNKQHVIFISKNEWLCKPLVVRVAQVVYPYVTLLPSDRSGIKLGLLGHREREIKATEYQSPLESC